jgi:integration host factor subunit beta
MVINWIGTPSHAGVNSTILTKAELIGEVARVAELPQKEAAVIVECVLDSMVKAIERGDKVEIRGFGTFRTRQRQGRIGRNPKTGARVQVPAKRIPFFKPSKELRDVVMKL